MHAEQATRPQSITNCLICINSTTTNPVARLCWLGWLITNSITHEYVSSFYLQEYQYPVLSKQQLLFWMKIFCCRLILNIKLNSFVNLSYHLLGNTRTPFYWCRLKVGEISLMNDNVLRILLQYAKFKNKCNLHWDKLN